MLDTQIVATKTNHSNELDAEIAELKEQIESAKTKRLQTLAIKDAEIADLEAQIAAFKTNRIVSLAAKDAEICILEAQIEAVKTKKEI